MCLMLCLVLGFFVDSSSIILSHDFRYISPNSSVIYLKDSPKLIRIVEYLGPIYLKLNADVEGYCPVRLRG